MPEQITVLPAIEGLADLYNMPRRSDERLYVVSLFGEPNWCSSKLYQFL